MSGMTECLPCATCGDRWPHDPAECRREADARDEVRSAADKSGVNAIDALDLWAHLRKYADPPRAAWAVSDVLDLGWRPVVGRRAAS
jgi:hypothetical protein